LRVSEGIGIILLKGRNSAPKTTLARNSRGLRDNVAIFHDLW